MGRWLVLPGGGPAGSYEVGAVKELIGEQGERYDGYAGVSVGAILASHLAMFRDGQEAIAASTLVDQWRGLGNGDVYDGRMFGLLAALWSDSVYDTEPLRRMLQKRLDPDRIQGSGKKWAVGAVSLNSGEYRMWDLENTRSTEMVDAVMASSSFPVLFPPIKIMGELWTDGGVRNVSPLRYPLDQGATHIDVLLPDKPAERMWAPSSFWTPDILEIALRTFSLIMDEAVENDLARMREVNAYEALLRVNGVPEKATPKRIVRLRVLRPSKPLRTSGMDFDPDAIAHDIELGQADMRRGWTIDEGGL